MPYISQKYREKLDPLIDKLSEEIVIIAKEDGYDAAFSGLLNYACTRLALRVARMRFGKMRYWIVALITGVFKNISDEFYRRVGILYENKQIAKSGDVDLYEEYENEINGM